MLTSRAILLVENLFGKRIRDPARFRTPNLPFAKPHLLEIATAFIHPATAPAFLVQE